MQKSGGAMYRYRLSKYNPEYRDEFGGYENNEWTSISDVGKSFDGVILNFEEYMRSEDAYVKSVKMILDYCKVTALKVTYIEKRGVLSVHEYNSPNFPKNLYDLKTTTLYKGVKKGTVLTGWRVDRVIRLLLREELYLHLEPYPSNKKEQSLKVFVGFDYLMGIHTNINLRLLEEKLLDIGMYLE